MGWRGILNSMYKFFFWLSVKFILNLIFSYYRCDPAIDIKTKHIYFKEAVMAARPWKPSPPMELHAGLTPGDKLSQDTSGTFPIVWQSSNISVA